MRNGMITDKYGTQCWWVNDKLHRTDGPAVIYADGTQYWYINGQQHRTDGPAVIRADGTQRWYFNDRLHRTDGPAVIYLDDTKFWWINGNIIIDDDVVNQWMNKLDISYPFDEEHKTLFVLTFGGE